MNDLTDAERLYLLEFGDMTEEELAPEALERACAEAEARLAAAVEEVRAHALTVGAAAEITGQLPDAVLDKIAAGDMYAVSTGPPSNAPLLPPWQFQGGRVIPQLRGVIAALPEDSHPLSVQHFMTTWNEEYLDGWPPADWLLAGRDPEAVIQYANELSWI